MRILIIDDELQILSFLRNLFQLEGWEVHEASSGEEGIEKIERERYDVILTDLRMPGADGIEVLQTVKKIQSDAEVVVMTGYGTVDSAIEAMRGGAFHYLTKPFRAEEVLHLIKKAYSQRQLKRENLFLKAEARGQYQIHAVIGTSAASQNAISLVQRLADTETPVWLEGESGTGRGFFARVVHYQSSRSGGLFVPVACAGVPVELLDRDLFGHAAGAYQRATLPRPGKIELANHGTVYLADIDKTEKRIQEKILKLLAAKTVSQVGSDNETEVDVRLVVSSGSDLDKMSAKGKFPAELRDRLMPGHIPLAPLRERAEDIPLLLNHHLFESNRDRKKPLRGFSEAAVKALAAYAWPGNVRELADLVKNIASRKKQGTVVDAADLPSEILHGRRRKPADASMSSKPPQDVRDAVVALDRQMARQALALAYGDREKAAALLQIEVVALEKLMKENGDEE